MNLINTNQKNLKKFLSRLTKLKIYGHLKKQRNGNINLESFNNGYFESIEYFRQRFLIEKRRAERNAYEFSFIVIELKDEDHGIAQPPGDTLVKKIETVLLATLKMILRSTDVVVKFCPFKLAILLPDTGNKAAESVIQRIDAAFREMIDQSSEDTLKIKKIYSYCYPAQADEINKLVDIDIITNTNSTIALEKAIKHVKSQYFQNTNSNGSSKNPSLNAASRATVVLENPFFLLNEVFFDCSLSWQKNFKRYLDFIISLLAITLLSPVFLISAFLIKITSPGPIFFKQERIGYMGKEFTIYKFRTMYQVKDDKIHQEYVKNFIKKSNPGKMNSESDSKIYKITNDPRITPIGRFLRRTSLDEIGQLFNVLKGDMSLVGPRPPIPYEVEMYDLWHKRRFLTVKPGLTGLWQIYGRNTIPFNDMIRLDLAYANNWSLALDFKILFKTVWAVLSMKGAY